MNKFIMGNDGHLTRNPEYIEEYNRKMDQKETFMKIVKPFAEICGVTEEELEELYLKLREMN